MRIKRKMYSGCAYHCAAGTGFSHSITRDDRAVREANERASERLHRAIPWNGMEWNGTEWQECYKISAFTVSARYSFTQTDSGTTLRCTSLLSVSFVLDVRCHRRHNVIARPLAVFKIVFMRSIYRHLIVNRDRSFSGIVLDHLFYSWRSMIIVDIIIVI